MVKYVKTFKGCKFKIYVERPKVMLAKRVRKNLTSEQFSKTGHTFVGLADENGVEKKIGLSASFYEVGVDQVAPKDRIEGLRDGFKKVKGVFVDETATRYDEVIEYDISRKQYEKAMDFVDKTQKENKPYCLFLNNCSTFACKVARTIGVKPPYSIIGIKNPHAYSLSIRAKKRINEIKEKMMKAGKKILEFFGSKEVPLKKTFENKNKVSNISKIITANQR